MLGDLIRGTRLRPVARALRRATWPPWRRVDEEDTEALVQLLGWVLREDSSCVDIGANWGGVTAHMVRMAPRGRHQAFEPLPHLAAELRRRYPGVTVHEAAASDEAGEAEFHHVVDDAGYSGLRRRTYARPDVRVERIRVRTCRLDDVLDPAVPIAFVKVDVEGAELQVLRGARETLARWRPWVVFEHGRGAADHYGTTPELVYRALADCGLSVFPLAGGLPYAEDEFAAAFARGTRWNYLARPYRDRHST
jgi:FkbM family methyltransferase